MYSYRLQIQQCYEICSVIMLHSLPRISVVEGNCSTSNTNTKELNGSYIKFIIYIPHIYDDGTAVSHGPSCELNYIIRNINILFVCATSLHSKYSGQLIRNLEVDLQIGHALTCREYHLCWSSIPFSVLSRAPSCNKVRAVKCCCCVPLGSVSQVRCRGQT